MAEIILTPEQQAVVDDRGGTLLVSAAAGSGKTKVLIDRVLGKMQELQCNIDDFLMITYTNAAATELRGKLLAQLGEVLAQNPDDRFLQKQMSRVYLAQISTVHSFCNKLLREYAHQAGLSSDFIMCDEQTVSPLRQKAMELTLEEAYKNLEEKPDIAAALDMLGSGRDDRELPALIKKAYDSLQCYENVEKRLEELESNLDFSRYRDAGQTVWAAFLIEDFRACLNGPLRRIERGLSIVCQTPSLAPYEPTLREDVALIKALQSLETWEEISGTELKFSTLKQIRKCPDEEAKEQVKKLRDTAKKKTKELLQLFALNSREVLGDLEKSAPALRGLLALTREYRKNYQSEKRRRHMLDYNDLEHEALRLLVTPGGTASQAAREISLRYVEIMVDEYQDTNRVQDGIFKAISQNEKNLFFVGDVKQSIYGFRLADPGIFLEKYKTYADYREAERGRPRKILLSDNFRSHRAVLSAANDVFRLTMCEAVGGLNYGEQEALRPKRNMPCLPSAAVELHCISSKDISSDMPVSRQEVEAEFVAKRIEEMLQGELIPDGDGLRPVQPEDIVILLRAMAGKAPVYLRALESRGISAVCAEDDLFESEEIVVLLSLLQILDNPHQDIPLLSVLLSPIFCFSTQSLAVLRGTQRNGDLYDLLHASSEGQEFIQVLTQLRDALQELSLRELLEEMDQRLFLRAIFGAMENGKQRLSHLERFFSLADSYENSGNYGLAGFLRYVETLREKGIGGETAQRKGSVRLMTIHKSKGLEFPVVFLADLAKEFNRKDSRENVLVDDRLGIACKVYDSVRRVRYPTVATQAIARRKNKESVSEEMRVLYVAMTRAQYRMVMSYCSAAVDSTLTKLTGEISLPLSESLIQEAKTMGDWVLMTALTRTEAGELFAVGGSSEVSSVKDEPWKICYHEGSLPQTCEKREEVGEHQDGEELLPYLVSPYPHTAATLAPGKLTATQLKGRPQDEEIARQTQALPQLNFSKPHFGPGEKSLTPAQRGTAIHLAMQFIRFEACTDLQAVQEELRRLLNRQFITAQQAQAISPEKILAFFRSETGKRVLGAKKVIREFQFSILEDASILDARLKGEQILLQGVTDCCLVEEDGLVILDFKSDRLKPGQEAQRAEHYRGQMEAYSRALGRIFQLPVKERILYFFATDSACSL